MPKVATQSTSPHTAALGTLKRNQACHQCRRRKLKCDAKRPCSTCVRSHAHAVAHAPAGNLLPGVPDCTFDDVPPENAPVTEAPRNKYERLENRISELEGLLRNKEAGSSHDRYALANRSPTLSLSLRSSAHPQDRPSSSRGASDSPRVLDGQQGTDNSGRYDTWSGWPPDLPDAELLSHLVDVFFMFHPHAGRLLHRTTFLASLSYPPTHPKFPAKPLLHAICAVGSLYTSLVTSPPLPDVDEWDPEEFFPRSKRAKDERPISFAEEQIKLAKAAARRYEEAWEEPFQVLQTYIVCSWYYFCHSMQVEFFTTSAHALRLSVPLGLNMCPPFTSITTSSGQPVSVLAQARTVVEDEMRRNAFWLAYANERQCTGATPWASSLDDRDISQLMPLRGDQFEAGRLVTPQARQWAHSNELVSSHKEGQVDSFILYLKATILLSRVRTFNLRFRMRHYSGEEILTEPSPSLPVSPNAAKAVDARSAAGFITLDNDISSFLLSFPPHLRNPVVDKSVDNHLYVAYLIPPLANIILHDPHADVRQSGCISALKILTSARAILDPLRIYATAFDITLLDPFCAFCWYTAARVLIRFLTAAIESNCIEQVNTLRDELHTVNTSLRKLGERYPLAWRYSCAVEGMLSGKPHVNVSPSL
ncbi:hypothetical protein CYLTODRAFT_417642 [Cylindrobasidium torrendii FP15055 ss-10]|uniref:Zn(2)-C6 fungal-type domain-containing protein n=1 Tax=Cylindrobasidium torrendii FP15055 ss-10 TaxID=1314674 RepID=A0A0D7BR18_9AGAR|nr:hypothetical protein CYLTODRAFT_417642 [Cylindrobasidium torrendii FP15055 ss-10]